MDLRSCSQGVEVREGELHFKEPRSQSTSRLIKSRIPPGQGKCLQIWKWPDTGMRLPAINLLGPLSSASARLPVSARVVFSPSK